MFIGIRDSKYRGLLVLEPTDREKAEASGDMEAAINLAWRNRFYVNPIPFEEAVRREAERAKPFLDALTEITANQQMAVYARELFIDYSLATNRLLTGDDLIVPYYDFDKSAFGKSTYDGYSLRFNFSKFHFSDSTPQTERLGFFATYHIDNRILEFLRKYTGKERIDSNILGLYMGIARLADHDRSVHNLTIPEEANEEFIARGSPTQLSGFQRKRGIFEDYEIFSEISQFQILQHMFSRHPLEKESVIKHAFDYMGYVQSIMGNASKAHDKDVHKKGHFLAAIYANRLFHVIGFNDKDLDRKFDIGNGRTSSLRERLNQIYGSRNAIKMIKKENPGLEHIQTAITLNEYGRAWTTAWAVHNNAVRDNAQRLLGMDPEEYRRRHLAGAIDAVTRQAAREGVLEGLNYEYFLHLISRLRGKKELTQADIQHIDDFERFLKMAANHIAAESLHVVGTPVMQTAESEGRKLLRPLQTPDGQQVFRPIFRGLPIEADAIENIASRYYRTDQEIKESEVRTAIAALKTTWERATSNPRMPTLSPAR